MAQFGGFQRLPIVIKNLLIINGIVWLIQITFGKYFRVEDFFALHDIHSPLFKPHQLITHMFMHDPTGPMHIIFNMLALWMFGSILENVWGPKRFLTFYLICGLGAAVSHLSVLWFHNAETINWFNNLDSYQQAAQLPELSAQINEATLGASGAVFGCLAAFAYLFPNTPIYLYFLFPIKAKWLILLLTVFELTAGIRATAGDNVAHFAHLGGGLVGFLIVYYWNRTNKNFY